MLENDANTSPSHSDEHDSNEYLIKAAQACAAGNAVLGMHLYLAAFERAQQQKKKGAAPDEEALAGLKRAWGLACSLKERSIAEYIFERMEPYLTSDETTAAATQLQDLALDKLEEYGLSREDLEDMSDLISQDFMGLDGARLMHVEHVTAPALERAQKRSHQHEDAATAQAGASAPDEAPATQPSQPQGAATANLPGVPVDDVADGLPGVPVDDGAADLPGAPADDAAAREDANRLMAAAGKGFVPGTAKGSAGDGSFTATLETTTYKELVGFDETIHVMHDFGIGMEKDSNFQSLVDQLNVRHGLDRMPACDTLLFRSPAREDANRFMAATVGELGLPVIRMRMEENLQGFPVLCVMAQADRQPKLNSARNAFEGPGVLMIEDLDLWASPSAEQPSSDDLGGLLYASLSRGAREAVNLIRSAVDNPDVYVLVSMAEAGEVDPFFYDLLEPLSVVDIDYPTDKERADMWMEIMRDHPSMRGLDRDMLVRYSEHMPRYDIYMAAREAVEEAYKASLVARRYVAVTTDNLLDKLAAYQPLDSEQYRALEDAVVSDFRNELDELEDYLNGEGR